ncbi:MAG TPA: hypothetical protein VLD86_14405 [Ilumatobacteraceae bacterium]|nr:hypothetical protein [Ilumatobacteraceae bacterium]
MKNSALASTSVSSIGGDESDGPSESGPHEDCEAAVAYRRIEVRIVGDVRKAGQIPPFSEKPADTDAAPEAGTIVALVLGRAFVCLAAGSAAGLAGAWFLARFVESFLFQMTPYAAPVYVVAGALLLAAGATAALIPALRATRVDPLITLKAG